MFLPALPKRRLLLKNNRVFYAIYACFYTGHLWIACIGRLIDGRKNNKLFDICCAKSNYRLHVTALDWMVRLSGATDEMDLIEFWSAQMIFIAMNETPTASPRKSIRARSQH